MIIGMQGFEIKVNKFVFNHDNHDQSIIVEISLINPSLIEVELGDVLFNIIYQDKIIFKSSFTNLILKTGKQELSLLCYLDSQNISTINNLFSDIATEKKVEFKVTVEQTQPVPWLQSAL